MIPFKNLEKVREKELYYQAVEAFSKMTPDQKLKALFHPYSNSSSFEPDPFGNIFEDVPF